MKINFILNEQDINSTNDASVITFMFKKIKDSVEIKHINCNNYKCEKASINIFFGCVNNLLLNYSKYNILIPNQHSFLKQWTHYLHKFDLILAKTKYIQEIFKTYVELDKIKYIGWRSTDFKNSVEKEYDEFLLYCCDNKYTDYKKIIDNWEPSFPTLNIVNGYLLNIKKKQGNLVYCDKLNHNEFENLFNRCGIHICLNMIDSFSYNINQCCLTKSIPLIINNGPMSEIVSIEDCFKLKGKKKKLNNYLGSKYDYESSDFKEIVSKIMNTNYTILESMGENLRKNALKNHSMNDGLFKDIMASQLQLVRTKGNPVVKEISDNDLPSISCITLSHNRKHMFKLATYNYNTSKYPKDKIEWLIYDTSNNDEKIEDLLPDKETREKMNISYYHNPEIISIGKSRRNACDLAKHDIIVFMDDDDYYFPYSINKRVNSLLQDNKLVGVRYLASMCITNIISYMNAPSLNTSLEKCISPASLCFYKSILNDKCTFDDENINECTSIVNNMELTLFEEISWENVIVSLAHKNNMTNRNIPKTKPNGCHYGFTDKLLKFILELDD
jgi:hypothetical protein